jgi:DNA-binding transcriptional regulator LsrR (DeoR family)
MIAAPPVLDLDDQMAARAAWHYFIAGITQDQIAGKLGIPRARVNRLIAEAREKGLVQIRITGKLAGCIELEEKLKARFGLQDAVVVPTPTDEAQTRLVIANAAGNALAARLSDGMSVGVGWGRTLRLSLRSVPHRPLRNVSVVSLLGGLTRGAAMNPHETASHLADLLEAQCYYVAAPALTDTEEARDLLMAQPMIMDVFEKGRRVDLAFISVGALSPADTVPSVGLMSPEEVESLTAAGAVGDISLQWIDVLGRVVDHSVNRRSIALGLDALREIPCVILASGGPEKVFSIHGALYGRLATIVVTDEATAEAVLAIRP